MNKMRVLSLSLSVLFLFAAEGRASQFFRYELAGYPKGTSDCTAAGQQVGDRFAKATGIVPFGTKASEETASTCRIQVTYAAAEKLAPVSTVEENLLIGKGAFVDAASCEASLSEEQARFARLTGLAPVVAYCERTPDSLKRPYVQRIESFGKPANGIFYFHASVVFGRILPNAADIEARMKASLAKRGYDVMNLALHDSPGGWFTYLSFSYYAKEERTFELMPVFEYGDEATCGAAGQSVDTALAKATSPVMGSFCVTKDGRSNLSVLVERPLAFTVAGAPDQDAYASVASCDADRGRVEAAYAKIGREVLGSVCGVKEEKAQMAVFLRGAQ